MREVIALKETLSKIETLAEAALYLTGDEERNLQAELIRAIEHLACINAYPGPEIQPLKE